MPVTNSTWPDSLFYMSLSDTPKGLFTKLIRSSEEVRKYTQAATVDGDGTTLGQHLVGLNFGDANEYRKTRIFRDEAFNRLRVQRNTSTDSSPTWVDLQYIDLTTGDVTVAGKLTVQSESPSTFAGGIAVGDNIDLNGHQLVNFYLTDFNAVDFTFKASAVAADFSASKEWTHTHNLNSVDILWNTYDSGGRAVIPDKVDTSNPNTAYFYFLDNQQGKAVVIGGMTGPAIVRIADEDTLLSNKTKLTFGSNFYLSLDSTGNPIVNLKDAVRTSGDQRIDGTLEVIESSTEPGGVSKTVNGVEHTHRLFIHQNDDYGLGSDYHSDTNTNPPGYRGYRSRGTPEAPTVVANNDILNGVFAYGYDGTDYVPAARIRMLVDGTPGSNDMPGSIQFQTTPDGSTSPTTAMFIDSGQDVSLPTIKDAANDAAAAGLGVPVGGLYHTSGAVKVRLV